MNSRRQWRNSLQASGASKGTVRLYSYYADRLADATGRELDVLTTDEIEAWLACDDWSHETRRSAQRAIRSFYRFALRRGLIDHDPCAPIDTVKEKRGVPRPTPDDVFQRACEQADPQTLTMLRLAAWCGLRRAEIANAHGDWLEGDLLRVRGKGGHERIVWCPPELRGAFVAAGTGPLFVGRYGGPVCADFVGRRLARACGPGWTAHNLRHRFASKAYAGTGDLAAIQEALGHASPTTTRLYVLVPQDHIRAVGAAACGDGEAA